MAKVRYEVVTVEAVSATKKVEGYAQLGLRVVEILRATYAPEYLARRKAGGDEILQAALDLGFLSADGSRGGGS